jgi:tetratricopeptide (TPR) repeat protein
MKLNSYEKWKNSAALLCDAWIQEGKPEEAYRLEGKVLLINPSEIDFHFRHLNTLLALKKESSYRAEALFLAFLAQQTQNYQQAYEILEKVQALFPKDVNVRWKLAELAKSSLEKERAEVHYNWLAEYYQSKNLAEKAVQAYRQILALNPEKIECREKVARIFESQGKTKEATQEYFALTNYYYFEKKLADKAIPFLQKILDLDPENAQSAILLARLYLEKNRIEEASKVIHAQLDKRIEKGLSNEAISFNKEWLDLLFERHLQAQALLDEEYLAKALFAKEKKEEAVALFEESANLALSNNNVEKFQEFLQIAGRFYLSKGDIGRASVDYQKLILTLGPKNLEKAKGLLEEFLRELLQREKIRELDQTLREIAASFEAQGDKKFWEMVLRRLAEVYVSLYKLQDAIKVYRLIVEKQGEDPEVYMALGELYTKEENWPLAVDSYLEAVKLFVNAGNTQRTQEVFQFLSQRDPQNPSLFSRMGSYYYQLGQWEKALEYYQKAMEIDSTYRPAVVGTAMTYAKKGMLPEMVVLARKLVTKGVIAEIVEEYKKALSSRPVTAQTSLDLGRLYKELGFEEEAILEFQKASRDPKFFLEACNELGKCFYEQGFKDLAIRQYRKALERPEYSDEELLEIRYNLARVHESLGMYREALELYNDILVVDIGYKDVSERIKNLSKLGESRKIVSPSEWGSGGKDS